MKVVILAGGFGTRIHEETHLKPKPMIEIGDRPVLWHIMKLYSCYGFNDFIICLGYKGNYIKEYFLHYYFNQADLTIDMHANSYFVHRCSAENWSITLVNTGLQTMTGGRLKRIASFLKNEPFMLAYGDGLADINLRQLLAFHRSHGKLATITVTKPKGRFGTLILDENNYVKSFYEKSNAEMPWVNAGFFVMEAGILSYLAGDKTVLEKEPLINLANDGQLIAYKHEGFWHPMDTLPEWNHLQGLWEKGEAPWKKWL